MRNTTLRLSAITIAIAAAAGCASMDAPSMAKAAMPAEEPVSMRSANTFLMHSPVQMNVAGAVPPGAKPGECYARVQTPAVFGTETKTMLKRAAAEEIDIIPARYGEVEKTVLVKEASERIDYLPAVYEWVEERVMVRPATTRTEQTPAVFETVTERVLETPARMVWKVGTSSPIQKVDPATGQIMCLVEEPATYKTVTKEIVKSAAATRTVPVPAEYETVKRQVVKTPATARTVVIPAEYKKVKVTQLLEPARQVRKPIPAQYQTVSNEVMVRSASVQWREILCQNNADEKTVQRIQRSLLKAGFDPGRTDGVLNEATFDAVQRYQSATGLPVDDDRYINIQTVESLDKMISS